MYVYRYVHAYEPSPPLCPGAIVFWTLPSWYVYVRSATGLHLTEIGLWCSLDKGGWKGISPSSLSLPIYSPIFPNWIVHCNKIVSLSDPGTVCNTAASGLHKIDEFMEASRKHSSNCLLSKWQLEINWASLKWIWNQVRSAGSNKIRKEPIGWFARIWKPTPPPHCNCGTEQANCKTNSDTWLWVQ